MRTPAVIFREYDIRGAADRDLTDETVVALGRAFGGALRDGSEGRPKLRVALARDCRLSSPRLHAAILEGLLSAGIDVLDVGIGPTPLLYFAVHHLAADGGVMVTGSHNPTGDNGFKLLSGTASFFGADLLRLRARVERGEAPAARRGTRVAADVADAYVERLTGSVTIDPSMRVVVDAGNGVGGPLALAAMRALGLDPDPLFCEMDGRFPHHHPDPSVEENVAALVARVRATGARVGIAFDGDADRLGVVDVDGSVIWGDRLLVLFARDVLRAHPGASVVAEAKCSQTLYDDVERHGGVAVMWKAGHSPLKTKLRDDGALLAGDMSGHIFFADRYYGFDDALYAALRLLEILSTDARSLGERLSDLPQTFATRELRIECPEAIKFEVVRRVTEHYERRGRIVATIDGARIGFDGSRGATRSWGLVRASNTGAALVMRFEADTAARCDAVRAEVEALVFSLRAELSTGVAE